MIYILEDDGSIRELISYSLNKTGNPAVGFGTPSELYAAVAREVPTLVLLDVMLPEEDGLAVLARLRGSAATATVPVIMLTAKDSEFDKVMALDAGADDYVTKPFGVMELVARVKAVLRRTAKSDENTEKRYTAPHLSVSVDKHEVLVDGTPVTLTYKEFSLLCMLFERTGSVMSRDRILREVWGYEFDGENRTVDVHIRSLRQKLGIAGDLIETVRGVGYKISAESR